MGGWMGGWDRELMLFVLVDQLGNLMLTLIYTRCEDPGMPGNAFCGTGDVIALNPSCSRIRLDRATADDNTSPNAPKKSMG